MADEQEKPVTTNHDRAVRAIALEHAVELARAGIGQSMTPDAIVVMADKFRAFLTVPGATGDYVVAQDGSVRGMLPPKGMLVLPQSINVTNSVPPPASDALAAELREFRQFIERWIAEERAANATIPGMGT